MFQIANQLNRMHFEQMEQLERRFYSDAFITPAVESYAYYRRFPLSTFAALSDDCVIGFLNLFPVKERIYQGIRTGTYNDCALTADDIEDIRQQGNPALHMFLSCIAVERGFRRQGATCALLRAGVNAYADVQHRCVDVITDNVTDDGRRFSERLGFRFLRKSDHGSDVYAMSYRKFAEIVLSK